MALRLVERMLIGPLNVATMGRYGLGIVLSRYAQRIPLLRH